MLPGLGASMFSAHDCISATVRNQNNGGDERDKTSSSHHSRKPQSVPFTEGEKEAIQCSICIKIGHVLECCKSGPCATCADLDHVFHQQHLDLEMWEKQYHHLQGELSAWKLQDQQELQEKHNIIEEMKMARMHLEEQHRRQTQAYSDHIAELNQNLLLLQNEMSKKTQEPDPLGDLEMAKKRHDRESQLNDLRTSFNAKLDALRGSYQKKYAQEMDEHFKKYTCMPQEAWQPFMDENTERVQYLTAQIEVLTKKQKLLHEALKHQEEEADQRVQSLTDQLQDLQMKENLQQRQHHVVLDKSNGEPSIVQSDLAQEIKRNDAIDGNLSNDLNSAKANHEARQKTLIKHILAQKEKYEREAQDQTLVYEQQLQSLQDLLTDKTERVRDLEQQLLPILFKQDRETQKDGDYIESLKQQCHEADEEGKRLTKELEGRKTVLLNLQSKQQAQQPNQFVIREAKDKKGKGKKKYMS